MHNVVILGHRPIIADGACRAEMNGLFVAQSLEIGPERIGAEELRIARMKFTKRRSKSFCAGDAQHFISGMVPNSVHLDIAAANSRFRYPRYVDRRKR